MAEFSLEDFASEKPPAKTSPSKGSKKEFSLDDFGGTAAPSKSSSSIFGDKVSTQTLSDLVTGKEPPKTTGPGTFVREAVLSSPGTAAGVSAATAVGTATAPFGPWVAIPSAIVAGGAAGFAANYLEEEGLTALEESSPLAKKYMSMLNVDKATREAGRKEHEYYALGGQLASAAPFVSTKTAATVLSKSLVERGVSGTIQAGVGAGQRAATGEEQDLGKSLLEFGGGALMPGKLTKFGEKTVPSKFKPKEAPITPPSPNATPEQVNAFKAKVKKEAEQRTSTSPLVEAAIRNKETGEIERMGPKHDEQRKAQTVDTHDQGFLDERGNFLDRQEAVDRAVNTGQVTVEGKKPVLEIPEDGLHSGDLRKAGDERFAITEDQPAGVPKKPSLPDEPPVDTTKTSPRDVKDDKEFLSIATDIYEKHGEVEAVEFYKGWKAFKETWAEPVKQVEEFVGTNLNNKLADERIVHNNTADLKETAGKDVNLEQLSFDIDKGVPLEGKAKEVATKFRALMDDLGQWALESGVIKGWHENYVARNVVSEGNAPKGALEEFMHDAFGYGDKSSGGGTKTTTKYGQERRLKTREDLTNHINGINTWLEQNGKDYRFKLKTDNLADIYKDYALSVQKAIENKNLIDNIKQIRNVNGESLIRPITKEEPRPYNWETIEHADLDGYAIHPDLVPALKFVFDSGPGMTMQALGTVSQVVKRINVIGSFFHAKSLMEVQSSAMIPLWTPVKEAIVLPIVEKIVKGVTGKNLQLSAVSKAVEQYRNGGLGDNVDTWVREAGLQLEVPEDVSRGILSSTGKLADNLIGKFGPKTRVLEKSLSTVEKYTLGMFDKYTWDYLHTGSKIMVADAYLEKARLKAAKEGKPFDEMASRKEIAQFVNDSFGGLNWFDAARRTEGEFAKRVAMAAYSPEGRRALQVALFAPDWTISTIRAFSSALPKGLNPTKWHPVEGIKGMVTPTTKADYARLYQFKTAVLYFTLINFINNLTANRDIWDNKDPTRIEWPDGTSMQAMKHAMEPYHWIADPDKTLANKLGFIPKAAVISIAGTEYASPQAQKIIQPNITGISSIDSALGRGKAVASAALPFQIQAGAGAPEGEGLKRALLGTAGFPVYGKTPGEKKLERAERELATKENAWRYRDKEIKSGRMPWSAKHDREKQTLDKSREKLDKKAEE